MEKRKGSNMINSKSKRSKIDIEIIIPLSNIKYIESQKREIIAEPETIKVPLVDEGFIEVVNNKNSGKWSFDDCPNQYILRCLGIESQKELINIMTKYDHLVLFDPQNEVGYPDCLVCNYYMKKLCRCVEIFERMKDEFGSKRCL